MLEVVELEPEEVTGMAEVVLAGVVVTGLPEV